MAHTRKFHLSSSRRMHELVVRACGRFTLGHGALEALWARQIEGAGHRAVTLDLACVSDMDARGLGVLASLTRNLAAAGRVVSVASASDVVARLVKLARLDTVLDRARLTPAQRHDCGAVRPHGERHLSGDAIVVPGTRFGRRRARGRRKASGTANQCRRLRS